MPKTRKRNTAITADWRKREKDKSFEPRLILDVFFFGYFNPQLIRKRRSTRQNLKDTHRLVYSTDT